MERLTRRLPDGRPVLVAEWEKPYVDCRKGDGIDRLAEYEDAEENGDIIKKKDVEQVVDEVSNLHLYRVPGDFDSYAPYNQGWQDACDSIVDKLNLWED